jgi:hypothetical protein
VSERPEAPPAHIHTEECEPKQGAVLCIIPGPSKVLATREFGVRWCFKCRKRLPQTEVLLGDEFPSYYEPIWVIRCDGCGEDHVLFPGREWSFEDV